VGVAFALCALLAAGACRRGARAETTEPVGARTAATRRASASVSLPANASISDASAPSVAPHRQAWTVTLRLATAPYAAHPDVLVHVPESLSPSTVVPVVVFLHGWFGCLSVIVAAENAPCAPGGPVRYAMDVVAQFDRARIPALLVVPQLAFDAASSAGGRMTESNGLERLLHDVLNDPAVRRRVVPPHADPRIGRVALVAHSGAFVPAAELVAHGGVEIHEIHMLDALYRDRVEFFAWVRAHAADFDPAHGSARRFTVIYTDREGTGARTRETVRRISSMLPDGIRGLAAIDHPLLTSPPDLLWTRPVFALRTAVRHEDIPRVFLSTLLEGPRWR
jgi:hypothetical protein